MCVKAAATGGETPIVDCRRVYAEMPPRIRDRFEEKGLMYVRHFTNTLDVSWERFFNTTDRSQVERFCRESDITCEWTQAGGLKTRRIGPAVVAHPKTGEKLFFNQIMVHHVSCLPPEYRESMMAVFSPEDLPRNVTFGDGSPIEDSMMDEIRGLYDRLAVTSPWTEGDVVLLDNMMVAHSRNPFTGERKIAVAMGEMYGLGDAGASS
jgi:alpha-ketoglutarate-dependent taurine dioxygenase